MNVSDVVHGHTVAVDLRRVDGEVFPQGLVAKLEVFLYGDDRSDLRLQIDRNAWEVEGATPHDRDVLRRVALHSLPRLAWLAQAGSAGRPADHILIQIHEFPSALTVDEPMEVGVDDGLVEDLRKRLRRSQSVDGAVRWLTERMLLPPRQTDVPGRAILSGSPLADAGGKTAFRLHGKDVAVDIQRGPDDRLRATRVVTQRRKIEGGEGRPFHLVTGPIRFCDVTVAGQFRGAAQTELDQIVAQADSYLGLWDLYNKKEHEAVLRRAREFGWIRYSRSERLANGDFCFHLETKGAETTDLRQRLNDSEGETLEAGNQVPDAIQGLVADVPLGRQPPFTGEQVTTRMLPPSITLRQPPDQDDRKPPGKGFLFLSLGGHEVRIRRRRDAWERIRNCTNPMPQLGLIVEGESTWERRGRRLEPLTRAVREVFPNPTAKQQLALDVALNTPDIALIQGPPGTGKTRVIAALQARLAEQDEGVSPDGLSGNTLLTSFQHDAVENAAAATRVMGLPAVKVGYRRNSTEARDGVDSWRTETAEAVRAFRGGSRTEDSVHAALRIVRQTALTHIRTPGPGDEPTALLNGVSEAAGAWLPPTLIDDMARLRAKLTAPKPVRLDEEDRGFALRAVRSLRTEAAAFSDDGPANARKVLTRLRRLDDGPALLTSDAKSSLERAAAMDPETVVKEALLAELESVKNTLIDRLLPDHDATVPRVHVDVQTMLSRVIDALSERAKETAPGVDIAIAEWLADLENDPDGIRDAVRDYSMVLAATCQQSVSPPMAEAKGGEDTIFRTVIVDEAARANPLDLLVPLSCAERRIVLVGDHRQLPQLLEPDVEREIEDSARAETGEALRQSLFERLFKALGERDKKDGITRTVTLDTQYRMHPVLGRFVSDQFYAPHGDHETFGSGRGEEEFEHDVMLKGGESLAGKVAAWIDVPSRMGREHSGRSKGRPVEARRVVDEAHAVVVGHSGFSVGIVTFYRAQRDAILEEMSDSTIQLTEPDDEGGYRVRDEWQRTADGRERLRIGTVDAFQGKEFDVVFLSLTRSNEILVRDEATRRRRYGFLLLENRLCVAMSRQQRLLVVVGDRAMAADPDAEASVPGLSAFLKLCEGPHGCVV